MLGGASMPDTIVITDASVLINFLVLDRTELLAHLPGHRFVVTDHVRAEVSAHYPDQLQRLEQALSSGVLAEIAVTDLAEVQLFAQLSAAGLGIGECSAIAVAANRKMVLAIDDKTAIKRVNALGLGPTILTTEQIVVLLIQQSILTIPEADAMKLDWELNHRFRLKFQSFADRLPPP